VFRLVFAVLLSWVGTARAQWLDSAGHLVFTGGGAARISTQTSRSDGELFRVSGVSPTNAHLSGAYFFTPLLGVSLESRGELLFAVKRDPNGMVSADSPNLPLPGVDASVALAVRWRPGRVFGLEGQVGPHFASRSGVSAAGTALQRSFLGPTVGAVATLSPSRVFGLQAWVRLIPVGAGLQSDRASFLAGAVGVQAALGALRLGAVQLGLSATVEGALSTGSFEVRKVSGTTDTITVNQGALRFGIGLSVLQFIPPLDVPKPSGPQALVGRVEDAQGQPVANAKVQLDARDLATSDARGEFSFASVPDGPHQLTAELEGLTPGASEVTAPVREVVVLRLGPATGPGTLVGRVSSNELPCAGATVTAVEAKVSAKSDAEGRYTLAKVGPGPVTVKVTAPEYKDLEEVVQVQPGVSATVDFTLVPKAAAAQATLRGLVRSKTGEAVKATVRVVELKVKLAVKADGRFTADVPSGKYTLVIEAKGYVTQTKTVVVSGGDQAIFHTELERRR